MENSKILEISKMIIPCVAAIKRIVDSHHDDFSYVSVSCKPNAYTDAFVNGNVVIRFEKNGKAIVFKDYTDLVGVVDVDVIDNIVARIPHEPERKYEVCAECGRHIYYADSKYYADECYQVHGEYFCEDCINDVVKRKFAVLLEE